MGAPETPLIPRPPFPVELRGIEVAIVNPVDNGADVQRWKKLSCVGSCWGILHHALGEYREGVTPGLARSSFYAEFAGAVGGQIEVEFSFC